MAKQNEIAEAKTVPAFMGGNAYAPKDDGIDASDLEIPQIKVLQATSPEVSQKDQRVDGAVPGLLFHTILGEVVEEVDVCVLRRDKRYVLFNPDRNGDDIVLARANDGVNWNPSTGEFTVNVDGKPVKWKLAPTVKESGLDQWGTSDPSNPNSVPAATLVYSAIFASPTRPELGMFVLNMQRSSEKVAKNLNSKIQMVYQANQAPPYGQVFKLTGEEKKKGSQTFFAPKFTPNGFVQDETVFKQLESMYLSLKDKEIKLQDSHEDTEKTGENAAPQDGEVPF